MDKLTQNIKEKGQLFPVTLRRVSKHRYRIMDGSHRCRILKALGVKTVLAQILDEEGIHEIPLIHIRGIRDEARRSI